MQEQVQINVDSQGEIHSSVVGFQVILPFDDKK